MTTDPQPASEFAPAPKRAAVWSKPVPLAIGAGVLGLLIGAGAGVGIAQIGDSSPATSSSATLTLPSTLSGGYKRDTTIDVRLKPSLSSALTTLGAGTDMALYASGSTKVLVEATRIGGGATLSAGMTYAKVGDAICSSSSSASEAICSRSSTTLTVKVTASDQATAAKYVDEVYKAVA